MEQLTLKDMVQTYQHSMHLEMLMVIQIRHKQMVLLERLLLSLIQVKTLCTMLLGQKVSALVY